MRLKADRGVVCGSAPLFSGSITEPRRPLHTTLHRYPSRLVGAEQQNVIDAGNFCSASDVGALLVTDSICAPLTLFLCAGIQVADAREKFGSA